MIGNRVCTAQQIVGPERGERVSQLDWFSDGWM
jgi:hypothetical protein